MSESPAHNEQTLSDSQQHRQEASEEELRRSTVDSLAPFFRPGSIAVVGASRDATSIGYRLLDAIRQGGYNGTIYPVNPRTTEIAGLKVYPSVRELPESVDLAVIVVPRDAVPSVLDECAVRGVKALIVISSGFAETGREGRQLQDELRDKVRQNGMRLVGPNCMGLLTTHPDVLLNATFVAVSPPRGSAAIASDSGALGYVFLESAKRLDLGISSFVSVGNRADVSINDLLEYWEQDDQTRLILLYLESFGNSRRFARIARRVGRVKPIVALKAGKTSAGQRAAGSHTAALAASEVAVHAMFLQTGVIRARTLEEMFHLGRALRHQPLPRGRRVAIVTNAGGAGILCADECEAGGLRVPEFSKEISNELAGFLPAFVNVDNPLDMTAEAGPDQYRQAVETLLKSNEIDALIVIFVIPTPATMPPVLQAIADAVAAARAARCAATVLACVMPGDECRAISVSHEEKIPCFPYPEQPATVLAKMAAAAEAQARPLESPQTFDDLDAASIRTLCRSALETRGPGWLTTPETLAVLHEAGLPAAPGMVAATVKEAVAAARQIGFPVTVKLASHQIVHKTEVGGVHLNLNNDHEVRAAFQSISEGMKARNESAEWEGVLVQPMLTGGVELMIGMTRDPLFGMLIAFGLGGVHVEVLGDVCFRIVPLTGRDAQEMIRSIRGYHFLKGHRGAPAVDIQALEEMLLRVSQLGQEIPEIEELDFNPVFALPPREGCRIADARIRVQ